MPGADDCDPWVDDEPCPDAVEPVEGDCPPPAGWPLEPLLPDEPPDELPDGLPDDPLEFVPAGALLPGVLPAEPPAPPLVGFDGNGDSGPPPWLELWPPLEPWLDDWPPPLEPWLDDWPPLLDPWLPPLELGLEPWLPPDDWDGDEGEDDGEDELGS